MRHYHFLIIDIGTPHQGPHPYYLEGQAVGGGAPQLLLLGQHVDLFLQATPLQLVQVVVLGQQTSVLLRLSQSRLKLRVK